MAQLAIVPCGVCRAIVLKDKQIYTKQYLTNLIFMKTNTMTEIKGYEAPNFDVVLAVVEAGFSLSFGDAGEAGQDGDIFDYDGEL